MNKTKQTILITGGGSGIGLSIAKQFLNNDYNVIITGRNQEKLEKVKSELPNIYIEQSDVTNTNDAKVLSEKMANEFDGIDILMNNAGVMKIVNTGDESNDLNNLLNEININFNSPIRMLHYFLPQLIKSANGTLINVSSSLAYVPFVNAPIYSGTKSAVHSWTQAIRPQLKKQNIRVVELLPPLTKSSLSKDAGFSNNKAMKPEELSEYFWKEFQKGKEEILPGDSKSLKLMSKLFPNFIFKQVNK